MLLIWCLRSLSLLAPVSLLASLGVDRNIPEGEDVVSFWMRKLPISRMHQGTMKGRSLRPLSDQAARLSSNEETASEGVLLRQLEGRLRLAAHLRGKHLDRLTFDDAKSIIQMVCKEGGPMTNTIITAYVEKRAVIMTKSGNLSGLVNMATPFGEASKEFVLAEPCVADLKGDMATRASLFYKLIFTRALIPSIMDGESKQQSVKTLFQELLAVMGDIDLIDIDDENLASVLTTSMTTAKCMLAMLEDSPSQENIGALVMVNEAGHSVKARGACTALLQRLIRTCTSKASSRTSWRSSPSSRCTCRSWTSTSAFCRRSCRRLRPPPSTHSRACARTWPWRRRTSH